MLDNYEKGRDLIESLNKEYEFNNLALNEADTRLRFIDRILIECLGWEPNSINSEDFQNSLYADYKLSLFRPVAVLEAKRQGIYFELPIGVGKIIYPLKTLCKDNPNIKDALVQVSGYCHDRGIQIGIVSNGWQFIAFIANRNDSIPPLEGDALIIPSLKFFIDNYKEVWNCLSKEGFRAKYLEKKLIGGNEERLPLKLSSTITNYPGIKNRNIFQTDLEILSDLVLEDVIKDQSIEKEFLQECYCKSGTLSQYSLLSKQILTSRYTYLFADNDKTAHLEQVRNKKGLSNELVELFGNSLSKRPILLIGDVGVGKSTFIDNLLFIEAPKIIENSYTFKIDLGSKAIVSLDIKKAVIKIIIDHLLNIYNIDIYEDDFVRHAYFVELENFKKSVSVKRLYEIDKVEAIKKEIDYLTKKTDDEVSHVKKSLDYICKNKKKQIIVFIDNCDQRNDNDQETAFLIAQEFASNWPMVVFVCLRPETFHRTKQINGALSGYHTKAFTISPPRIDEVLLKRLRFAQKITKGDIALTVLQSKQKFSTLYSLIQAFIDTVENSDEIYSFIENISNGNIRKSIELIKKFFGSGHVDTEKISGIIQTHGTYLVPVHEILRSVIYGDNAYYSPINADIINLFDVRNNDEKEHFLIPIILGLLIDYSQNNRNGGFIGINDLYSNIQKHGYIPSSIDTALDFMFTKGLFETSEKGNLLKTENNSLMIRATGSAVYHINFLTNNFTYFDAIIVDVPIFDPETKCKIHNISDISDRIERVLIFINYFDNLWAKHKFIESHFDWNINSKSIKKEIDRIKEKIERKKFKKY
jgi:hypothetical protein